MDTVTPGISGLAAAIGTNMIPLVLFVLAIIFRKKRVVPWLFSIAGILTGIIFSLGVLVSDDPAYAANNPFGWVLGFFLVIAVIALILVISAKDYRNADDEDDEDEDEDD